LFAEVSQYNRVDALAGFAAQGLATKF